MKKVLSLLCLLAMLLAMQPGFAATSIPKPGEECTAEEIQTYVRDHMAKHKVPRYVVFVDSFPMNAAGKILKYKMREEAAKLPEFREAAGIVTA